MNRKSVLIIASTAIIVMSMLFVSCGASLNGTWEQNGMEITFKGGKIDISYFGDIMMSGTYKTSGNNLTITIDGESETGTFSISGNQLTLTVDGDAEVFTRK